MKYPKINNFMRILLRVLNNKIDKWDMLSRLGRIAQSVRAQR